MVRQSSRPFYNIVITTMITSCFDGTGPELKLMQKWSTT